MVLLFPGWKNKTTCKENYPYKWLSVYRSFGGERKYLACWHREELGLVWTLREKKRISKYCMHWVRSLGWEDLLEKGMATHSSILTWRIPWTIQSRGLQRVGHDWVTFTFTFHVFSILIFIIIFLGEAGRYCRKQSRLWLPFLQLSSLRFSTCKMRMIMLIQLAHLVWI